MDQPQQPLDETALKDEGEKQKEGIISRHHHHCTPVAIASIVLYLVLWVANCEKMQGVANGQFAPRPYDHPAFLSWTAYNFLLLSWLPLTVYCQLYLGCTIIQFLEEKWAGPSGLSYMVRWSCIMIFLLLSLNILWVVGLLHISVAVSNAIYQLQVAVTIGLDVWWLGDRLLGVEILGILISSLGVALIVIPPILEDSSGNEDEDSGGALLGTFATLISAVIWAVYQLTWKIISIDKPEMSGIEGLMDTFATLGMMGLANLLLGWPVVLFVHWARIDKFETPSWDLIPALTLNGLVEFSFDTSCAVAIFLTSPVITAITAPLTIPISLISDHFIYGSPFQVGSFDWIGSFFVLVGVVWMELKCAVPWISRGDADSEAVCTETPLCYEEMSEHNMT